jgi:hypothetical protein
MTFMLQQAGVLLAAGRQVPGIGVGEWVVLMRLLRMLCM